MTETTTTRKRNTRKTTKEEVITEPVVNQEEVIDTETVIEEVKVEEVEVKRELTDDTKIVIMNNTMGVYGYRNGNKAITLSEYGDTAKITFEELTTMYSSPKTKRHITDAFILILDQDAVDELGINKLYANILDDKGVDRLLADPSQLKEVLPKLPKGMQETVIIKARKGFKSTDAYTRLTDIRIVNIIEEVTGHNITE